MYDITCQLRESTALFGAGDLETLQKVVTQSTFDAYIYVVFVDFFEHSATASTTIHYDMHRPLPLSTKKFIGEFGEKSCRKSPYHIRCIYSPSAPCNHHLILCLSYIYILVYIYIKSRHNDAVCCILLLLLLLLLRAGGSAGGKGMPVSHSACNVLGLSVTQLHSRTGVTHAMPHEYRRSMITAWLDFEFYLSYV